MSYVIHGASGAQGAPLLLRLQQAGVAVVAAVHSGFAPFGARMMRVDYGSVESLIAAYRGATGVFVHLPQIDEGRRLQYAQNIVEAVAAARPSRVVVSTSGDTLEGSHVPTSAIDVLVTGLAATSTSSATVAPHLFLENLMLPGVFRGVLSEGVLRYPLASERAVSWSSHLDVAKIAERLLLDPAVTGSVAVGHFPGLIGKDLVAAYTEHLGRAIRYEPIPPEAFMALAEPILGRVVSTRLVVRHRALGSGAAAPVIDEASSAQQLFGILPRPLADWLGGVATSFLTVEVA